MARHVLILSASLRAGSNSEALANAFADGARAAGHTVELVSLRGKNIAFCRGCLACQTLGRCVIDDDAVAITEKMQHADVIVFATPIYYYEMSGQLKTLLDRANALFPLPVGLRVPRHLPARLGDRGRAGHGRARHPRARGLDRVL